MAVTSPRKTDRYRLQGKLTEDGYDLGLLRFPSYTASSFADRRFASLAVQVDPGPKSRTICSFLTVWSERVHQYFAPLAISRNPFSFFEVFLQGEKDFPLPKPANPTNPTSKYPRNRYIASHIHLRKTQVILPGFLTGRVGFYQPTLSDS